MKDRRFHVMPQIAKVVIMRCTAHSRLPFSRCLRVSFCEFHDFNFHFLPIRHLTFPSLIPEPLFILLFLFLSSIESV